MCVKIQGKTVKLRRNLNCSLILRTEVTNQMCHKVSEDCMIPSFKEFVMVRTYMINFSLDFSTIDLWI